MRKTLIAVLVAFALWSCALAQVTLEWDANTDGVDGYNVYRSVGSGYVKLNVDLIIGVTYTDTTAVEGADYSYVVTAMRDGLESGYSNELEVEMPWTTPPLPPTNLKHIKSSARSYRPANDLLYWDRVEKAIAYRVDFKASASSAWKYEAMTLKAFYLYPSARRPYAVSVQSIVGRWLASERVVER